MSGATRSGNGEGRSAGKKSTFINVHDIPQVFKRFVEIGRVALINTGPNEGKLCVIIDVIDQRKVSDIYLSSVAPLFYVGSFQGLVTSPSYGVARQPAYFAQLNLLDIKIKIPRSARDVTVKKAWEKADVTKKWEATSYSRRLARRAKRASLSDFDRFRLMVLKKQVRAYIFKNNRLILFLCTEIEIDTRAG